MAPLQVDESPARDNSLGTCGVIGLGTMGSALAAALVGTGHRVTVWNRTPEKAAPFAETADVARSALHCCRRSDVVVVSLSDYATTESILHHEDVEAALRGKVVVELTTGTPAQARQAQAWARDAGIEYLDGAIMGYPRSIATGHALIFYAGPTQTFERSRPVLTSLSEEPVHVGEEIGSAATIDLALLEVFFGTIAAVLHGAALCRAEGYSQSDYFARVPGWLGAVGSTLPATEEMVTSGTFTGGNSRMDVNARAVGHLVDASRHAELDLGLPVALHELFENAVKRGQGAADLPAAYVAMESQQGSP